MKLSGPLLAVAGATVLLAALVSAASAGRLSSSTQSIAATWTRMDFSGGFGTVECEVTLAGTYHTRTITKTANSLVGYITAANIPRCARGGATILRETLPWHVTYGSFAGTLPNITDIAMNVIGLSFTIREPTFGVTCLARSTASNVFKKIWNFITNVARRIVAVATALECRGGINVTMEIRGNSSSNSALTVTLI